MDCITYLILLILHSNWNMNDYNCSEIDCLNVSFKSLDGFESVLCFSKLLILLQFKMHSEIFCYLYVIECIVNNCYRVYRIHIIPAIEYQFNNKPTTDFRCFSFKLTINTYSEACWKER